jgi:hypothetical protein
MHMKWTPGAVLLASLLLGGCGDDGEPGTPDQGAEPSNEQRQGQGGGGAACELLNDDEVSDLFGHPASAVPAEDEAVGESSTCLWQATADQGAAVYQLQLSVFSGSTELFDPDAWGGTPEAVEGLGDQAFVVRSGGLLGTTAGYLEGDRSVFLSYARPVGDDAVDTATQADDVVELLRTVDDRLD